MTFFAIDVGNTRLKWAQYASARPGARLLAYGAEFLENIESLAETRWSQLASPEKVLGCIVAGEGVRRRVQEQLELWDVQPRWVASEPEAVGVVNGYDHPSRLGVDRWIAMIGARQRVLSSGNRLPLIVVMVGTAVTVDAVDDTGRFLGGLILPGHGIMLKALESGTAGLHVPTGEVQIFPTNTSDALTSGGTYAIAGAVERMIQHLRRHSGQEPVCIMTGGAAWKMAPSMTRTFELVDHLIFEGLLSLAQGRRIETA
ncbi:type III pantothenate kinase [Xylophilus ampelinus]|uniref:Type III pantothenate kinase n=1 Tax=Xylophilus ampelinus TaxID=54067 RepID=A0A318SGC7_9BURK|nr:type III pantothenate kinase [Xylophilus ampelinus]MCS4510967.1 type III pantothenate kinase [Xylophilus ampelinus]PYE76040.1 type III pantothenate kinase [Xylophilus ampelinus]